jgi:hypothetical protein
MPAAAADRPDLAGRWTLNRELSQFPRDVGFGVNLSSIPGSGPESGGGLSGGGGIGTGAILSARESEEDARRMALLVNSVRNPSLHLTIAQTDTSVAITDEQGGSLTFHPDGRQETQTLDQVPLATTTRWEGARLVVRYAVEQNRELRYTYSRTVDPPQLVVQVQFIERGGHDTLTRVYEPAREGERVLPERTAPPQVPKTGAVAPQGTVRASDLDAPPPTPPDRSAPADRAAAPVIAPGPDGELRGLTTLGVVVEELSPQAAACGLSQGPIEAAVAKSFTDAGFKVRRNSDEDTYVYVHIMTTSTSAGLCVSGYDVYLYTHTTATLPYQTAPVLVQILLLHKGGMGGGAAAAHADAVLRNVKQYVDEFAARMRAANQSRH